MKRTFTGKRPFLLALLLTSMLVACAPTTSNSEPQEFVADTVTETTPTEAATKTSVPETATPTEETAVVDPTATRYPAERYAEYEIVTLLPKDRIPAIDNPEFLTAQEADEFYDPDELILGVEFDGDARAYSVPFLSNHEIVNDMVAGRKIAVTW